MQDEATMPPADAGQLDQRVGRPVPEREGLWARLMAAMQRFVRGGPATTEHSKEECPECRYAQGMLARGFHSIHCNTCGCHWLSVDAAKALEKSKPPNVRGSLPTWAVTRFSRCRHPSAGS